MNKKNSKTSTNIDNKYYKNKSPKANDSIFIDNDSNDNFSIEGTIRYGEESDGCDI